MSNAVHLLSAHLDSFAVGVLLALVVTASRVIDAVAITLEQVA